MKGIFPFSFWALILVMLVLLLYASYLALDGPLAARAEDDVQAIACAPTLRWDCATVRAIIWAESRDDASAVNPTSGAAGWFQIHPIHGYSIESLLDPVFNTQVAYGLWLQFGYTPWMIQ